jgi:hypothetical protein
LSNGETIAAGVVNERDGRQRCDFARPLSPEQLEAARAQCEVAMFDRTAPEIAGMGNVDRPSTWPLPVRAAIAIGGTAALWGLIGLALR